MDVLTPEQRRRNMKAIKNKNTRIEQILAKAMWAEGIRYRKNDSTIFGKPDFVMKGLKIAIFCDSEFFHGKDWDLNKKRIQTNSEFWINKIEYNIKRDNNVNKTLQDSGWIVLRFWGEEIKKETEKCISLIKDAVRQRRTGSPKSE